jgi:hypothetical protein
MEHKVCVDERHIGYAGDSQGEYCGLPFLMNEQYFETCTKWKETTYGFVNTEEEYWCPSPQGVDTTSRLWNLTGDTALCNDYLFPKDNGCEDHYEAVRNTTTVTHVDHKSKKAVHPGIIKDSGVVDG